MQPADVWVIKSSAGTKYIYILGFIIILFQKNVIRQTETKTFETVLLVDAEGSQLASQVGVLPLFLTDV